MPHISEIPGDVRPRAPRPAPAALRLVAACLATLVLAVVAVAQPTASAGATVATAVIPAQARTWVVDAVDSATNNLWVSADTGTSTVTVSVGDTVEWQFDQATMSHDLTSIDSSDAWDPRLQDYRDPGGAPIRYTFTEPGTYDYWCSIHGGTMRGTVVVRANRAPTANPFVGDSTGNKTGPAPFAAHFEARATDPDGDPLTYEWDFGYADDDSDRSTAAHGHHTYAAPGRYPVSLRVSDGRGGVYSQSYQITVTGGVDPVVTASADKTTGPAPLSVVFYGRAEDEQGDADLTYEWDFGDPTTELDQAASPRGGYTYEQPGTYTATLTVTDPQGHQGTDTVTVVATGVPAAPRLGVAVTATPSTGVAPLPVDLTTAVTNASTTGGTVRPFADGVTTYPGLTGTAEMVRGADHTMTSLAVSGLEPNAAHMVHVHEQACGDANAGAHFRFDETQPYGQDNEIWLPFTTDAQGDGEPMVHSSRRAGPKAVAIVIHDPDNPAKRIGCVDLVPTGLAYAWTFGDGTTGTGAAPQHTYAEGGTFDGSVTVTDPVTDQEATDTFQVVVTPGEDPDTEAPQTRVTAGPSSVTRSRNASLRWSSTEPGSTFECRVDSAAYEPCGAGLSLRDLRDGAHRVSVRAVDAAGNRDATPAVRTWRVDTRGPSISLVGHQPSTRDRTPTVRATVRDVGSELTRGRLTLRVDGVVRAIRYDARTDLMTWTSWTSLSIGRHTLRLDAVDPVGNRTVKQWTVLVRH
ncbi:PKD domain-containing protein [Nocardioides plantarum]|uniref:PKD domain-containing protein n=1 Tax=Nocardioides plantarum TaxID=29299 RepID=A0ABV5KG55_9ACTN|nr:PKD domain-containing protein [Nocardioides plantarum]